MTEIIYCTLNEILDIQKPIKPCESKLRKTNFQNFRRYKPLDFFVGKFVVPTLFEIIIMWTKYNCKEKGIWVEFIKIYISLMMSAQFKCNWKISNILFNRLSQPISLLVSDCYDSPLETVSSLDYENTINNYIIQVKAF